MTTSHSYHEGGPLCGEDQAGDCYTVQPHMVDCPDCYDLLPPELVEDLPTP